MLSTTFLIHCQHLKKPKSTSAIILGKEAADHSRGSAVTKTWTQILALPLTSCAALSKFYNLCNR